MKFIAMIIIILTVFSLHSILTADEGMWMPHQMQELQLDKLGLKMNPADLYMEDGIGLMNAIVNLGGGTGAFVSKEGLILTNHHVAFSTIQQASDAKNDYLKDGFIAWKKNEELPAIGKYADVLISYEEITEKIISKIRPDMSLEDKWQTLDQEQKKIITQYTEDDKLQILNGRWGPYISYGKENFRIPKGNTPEELTLEQCMKIIEESREKKNKKK